jgi:excisionase family DNA binding protein
MTDTSGKTWLTRQEAADRAGRDLSTIARWLREGRLSKHVSGLNRVCIDADELDALMNPTPADA